MRKNKRNVLPLLGMRIYVHSEQRTEEICGASRGAHTVQKLVNKVLLVYYHWRCKVAAKKFLFSESNKAHNKPVMSYNVCAVILQLQFFYGL